MLLHRPVGLPSLAVQIRIFPDAENLAEVAATDIAGWLAIPGHRTIGLAGGSTPRTTYELLRESPGAFADVDGWMTDERLVPIDHPDSNAGMAASALFDHVEGTLHPCPIEEGGDPDEVAEHYERTLAAVLPTGSDGRSQPGLVLLGVGDDGHTASLFPGTPALDVADRDFVANWVEDRGEWRLTATFGLLARARRTMFLVSGERKADIVADIVDRDADHPASRVANAAKDCVWLLDQAAASKLSF
jgi:6-phosphogluconolactonase